MAKKSKKKKKNEKNKKQQQIQQQLNSWRGDELVVSMNTTPTLLRVFISIGCGLKYVGLVMLAMFGFVLFTFTVDYVFSWEIRELVAFWKDFIAFLGSNLMILMFIVGPFILWYILAKWLKKHHKAGNFRACEDKVFIDVKNGRPISCTYEELGLSIRTRKIKFGPDWIEIPYDTGVRHVSPEWIESPIQEDKIRLYSFGKKDVGELLKLLSEKCSTPNETQKIEENIGGYTDGFIMTYFVGWPILLGSVYLCSWIYALEGYASIGEMIKALPANHTWVLVVGFIGILLILMGYWIKFLYFILLRKYFKPYKDYFRISW